MPYWYSARSLQDEWTFYLKKRVWCVGMFNSDREATFKWFGIHMGPRPMASILLCKRSFSTPKAASVKDLLELVKTFYIMLRRQNGLKKLVLIFYRSLQLLHSVIFMNRFYSTQDPISERWTTLGGHSAENRMRLLL